MKKAWQIPISNQRGIRPAKMVAHMFQQSAEKRWRVQTNCGILVTPGFAIPAGGARRCKRCLGMMAL